MKWLSGNWPFFHGLLLVIAVTLAGILPPTIMDELGVRLTPNVPWVAPAALAWMWLVWRFLNRPGWRRDHLATRKLSLREWIIALTALAAGTGAIHWLRMATLRWLSLPDVRIPSLPACSVSVLLSSFLVTALAAGLFEEAAYRGYLRRVLEERYGPKAAIILSALFFSLAHLSRGPGFFAALPSAFLFGCLYGAVAWKTGSIRPGVVMHFSYNLARLLTGWFLLE